MTPLRHRNKQIALQPDARKAPKKHVAAKATEILMHDAAKASKIQKHAATPFKSRSATRVATNKITNGIAKSMELPFLTQCTRVVDQRHKRANRSHRANK
jgi:hypothetical protein